MATVFALALLVQTPLMQINAAGEIFTGEGTQEIVIESGSDTSVKFSYSNTEDEIFVAIWAIYTWDASKLTYDSIESSNFVVVVPQSDTANGKLVLRYDYPTAAARSATPEVTINFVDAFVGGVDGDVAVISQDFNGFTLPSGDVELEVSFLYGGNPYYAVLDTEADIINATLTFNSIGDQINALFDGTGKLLPTVTQDDIDDLQVIIDALPAGTAKNDAQLMLNEAKAQLAGTITPPKPPKPTVPNTGIADNAITWIGLVAVSAGAAIFLAKKKKAGESSI